MHVPADLPLASDRYRLIHAEIGAAEIAPASIDCIVTDPPYPEEYLDTFSVLAERARRGGRESEPGEVGSRDCGGDRREQCNS